MSINFNQSIFISPKAEQTQVKINTWKQIYFSWTNEESHNGRD